MPFDMALPKLLFGRQDLSVVTGAPDVVLGYWIKDGILLPEDAGSGRGRHLRFSRIEAALACILARLRRQGVATSALTDLANAFHQAAAWIQSQQIDTGNFEQIDELVRARAEFLKLGQPDKWKQHLKKVTADPWLDLSPRALRFVEGVDSEEWSRNANFYGCLVDLGLMRPKAEAWSLRLARREDGSWIIIQPDSEQDYISIDLKAAAEQLWSLDK